MNPNKPNVAFFDFAGCEGCQIELTNFGSADFLALLEMVNLVEFREAMSERGEHIDIAFVEGSIARREDIARIRQVRERAKMLIAFGACACNGGINALKNHGKEHWDRVYGEHAYDAHLGSISARGIASYVKVDFEVPGCPIDRSEFLRIVGQLIRGETPTIPTYPVCVECKRNETICRYDQGDYCLGMVARAGCGAPCTADGIPCEACRGLAEQANLDSLKQTLMEQGGLNERRAEEKSRMFTANLRRDYQ